MEEKKITIGGQESDKDLKNSIPKEFIDTEFLVPTEEIDLPSQGIFYKNKKKSVMIKYLTTEEDDILYSPELLRSGKVLDALLQVAVIDKELRPDDILVGDRNFILIHLRKTGLGNIYNPGKVQCPSCGEEYEPEIDLSLLTLKPLEYLPDENGEFEFNLALMKKKIKFRLLTGADENRITKSMKSVSKKVGSSYKVSSSVTERYRLQIMEVEGNRDKIYISKLISSMPMRDSLEFREYAKIVSPGVDFNYLFSCSNCGHSYSEDVPLNYRLFYPNAEV